MVYKSPRVTVRIRDVHLKPGAKLHDGLYNWYRQTYCTANLLKLDSRQQFHVPGIWSFLLGRKEKKSKKTKTKTRNQKTKPCDQFLALWETSAFISLPKALFNFGAPAFQIWSIKLTASFWVGHHTSKWAQAGLAIVLRNVRFTFHSSWPRHEWIGARKQTILLRQQWGGRCKEKYLSCLCGSGSPNGPPIKQHHKGHFTAELAI